MIVVMPHLPFTQDSVWEGRSRAVLTLHKCNAAMIFLKILFVYNIFHIFEYRFFFPRALQISSPEVSVIALHQLQLKMPGWGNTMGLSRQITVAF